jgi:hypothetical protein
MNSSVTHNDITFTLDMDEPPCYLKDRGWVHLGQLVGTYDRDQLKDLLGLKLWGSPILGIESFAVCSQANGPIGILLDSKKWDGKE